MNAKPLAELKTVMVKRPQVLINVPVAGVAGIQQDPQIVDAVASAEAALNGIGRVLLRPSGTEPVVRVMVEGNDEALVRKTAEKLAGAVEGAV